MSKSSFKSKDLKRHYRAHEKAIDKSGELDEKGVKERTERLAWTMQLVAEGKLSKAKEYAQAASILYHGETSQHYLAAHLLALVAAKKGDKDAPRLSAETLDRWLLSIGRAQQLGTQLETAGESERREPWQRVLPEHVREAFGLEPLPESQ